MSLFYNFIFSSISTSEKHILSEKIYELFGFILFRLHYSPRDAFESSS